MAGEFKFGAVVYWDNFKFDNGGSSNKLLVVLGAKTGHNLIAVLTTSVPPPKNLPSGCHPGEGYYVFRAGEYGWPKDTWVQLYRPFIFSAAEVLSVAFSDEARTVRNLPQHIAAGIRNCLKQSPDLSPVAADLLE